MTAIAQALSTALLHFIWQGTLIGFLLWLTLSMLRNRPANERYAASCAALAFMAALPVVTAWMVYRQPGAGPIPSAISLAAPASIPGAARSALESAPLEWMASWRQWALPVWSVGVLVFALRLVLGCRHVAELRRLGGAAEGHIAQTVSLLARRMKTGRPIRVLISTMTESPSVVGWLRPAILLPAATLAGLEPEQLRAVLAHEIAHIRRHDYLVNLAQTMVETLLFYHPAVWWASARIRHERELCCDDAAVAVCGDALCYARALTSLERLRAAAPRLALGSTGGSLLYRIQRLAGVRQELGPSKLPGIAALALGLACFAATVHWAKAQQTTQHPIAGEWGITVSSTAEVLHRDRVPYPEATYKNGIQGTVVLEATLDQSGNVADARVLSGPPELRKAALQSVLQWQFANAFAGETQQVAITFQQDPRGQAEQKRGIAFTRDGKTYLATQGNVEFQGVLGHFDGELQETQEARERTSRLPAAMAELASENKALEEQMAQIQQNGQEQTKPAIDAPLAQLARMSEELESTKRLLDEQTAQTQQSVQEQRQAVETQLESEIAQLGQQLAEYRKHMSEGNSWAVYAVYRIEAQRAETENLLCVGSRLARIEIEGFPDSAKAELIAKIPIRIGEILSAASIENAVAKMNGFDPHVVFQLRRSNDGDAVLQIVPWGADWERRK